MEKIRRHRGARVFVGCQLSSLSKNPKPNKRCQRALEDILLFEFTYLLSKVACNSLILLNLFSSNEGREGLLVVLFVLQMPNQQEEARGPFSIDFTLREPKPHPREQEAPNP